MMPAARGRETAVDLYAIAAALEDLDAKAPQGPVKIGRFALKGLDVANLMRSTAQFAAPGAVDRMRGMVEPPPEQVTLES